MYWYSVKKDPLLHQNRPKNMTGMLKQNYANTSLGLVDVAYCATKDPGDQSSGNHFSVGMLILDSVDTHEC